MDKVTKILISFLVFFIVVLGVEGVVYLRLKSLKKFPVKKIAVEETARDKKIREEVNKRRIKVVQGLSSPEVKLLAGIISRLEDEDFYLVTIDQTFLITTNKETRFVKILPNPGCSLKTVEDECELQIVEISKNEAVRKGNEVSVLVKEQIGKKFLAERIALKIRE